MSSDKEIEDVTNSMTNIILDSLEAAKKEIADKVKTGNVELAKKQAFAHALETSGALDYVRDKTSEDYSLSDGLNDSFKDGSVGTEASEAADSARRLLSKAFEAAEVEIDKLDGDARDQAWQEALREAGVRDECRDLADAGLLNYIDHDEYGSPSR